MTTNSSDIRSAWNTYLWKHPAVLALTPRVYDFDVLADSQSTVTALYHQTRVNFFTCTVQRATDVLAFNQALYTFQVVVQYYLQQADVAGTTYNLVTDRLELVDALVLSELKANWQGLVDVYGGAAPQGVAGAEVDGKACWRGGLVYTATKKV